MRIFFDNHATTQLDPRVFDAMRIDLEGPPANPSSVHWFGQRARQLLVDARHRIADFFGVRPDEVTFTSGGTESLNTLLRSIRGHLVTTAIEHSSIYRTTHTLNLDATYLPVGSWGAPRIEEIEAALRPHTAALLFSAANGETGAKLDIEAVADLALQRNIPLFLDAVAYIGKERLPRHEGIAAIAVSGHKFHAPKGVGCLICRRFTPLLTGGAQEGERRAGTENLAGILGLARAIDILREEQDAIALHLSALQRYFEAQLRTHIPDLIVHASSPRVPSVSNIAFPGVDGEALLMRLDLEGIAAAHGSACSSGALEPSRVLLNMGLPRALVRSSLRFSFSRFNTMEEIDRAIPIIARMCE